RSPLGVFLFAVDGVGNAYRPRASGRIALRRPHPAIQRNQNLLVRRVVRSSAGPLIVEEGPQHKKLVVSANRFHIAPTVSASGYIFMFVAGQGQELPSLQSVAMPEMEQWVNVVVSHQIAFPALYVKRHHDEFHLIPKETIFQAAIKWDHGRIIFFRNGRSLLEIKRKESEAANIGL